MGGARGRRRRRSGRVRFDATPPVRSCCPRQPCQPHQTAARLACPLRPRASLEPSPSTPQINALCLPSPVATISPMTCGTEASRTLAHEQDLRAAGAAKLIDGPVFIQADLCPGAPSLGGWRQKLRQHPRSARFPHRPTRSTSLVLFRQPRLDTRFEAVAVVRRRIEGAAVDRSHPRPASCPLVQSAAF